MNEIYTLLVEVGRGEKDGLPEGSVGAAFLLFTSAKDEDSAVHETVQILREANLNPLEVSNIGSMDERADAGYEFSDEELELAKTAHEDGAIVILDKQIFYDDDDNGQRH